MPTTKNLGIVKAIFVGSSAPTNTKMLWYNTTDNLHYYYNTGSSTWVQLIAGGSSVTSVNGQTGVVVLDADDIDDTSTTNKFYDSSLFDADLALKTTDDLTEGATNLYWTQARFDTAFGLKDTDDLSEGSTNLYYTDTRARAALSASTPLSYDSVSGAFTIAQATTSTSGYLSSTDWNTFNNKMTAPSGTLNKLVKFTPSGTELGDSQIEDDGSNIGIGVAPNSAALIKAQKTGGGAGDYDLWNSTFSTSQDQSKHFNIATSSAVTASTGISNSLYGATTRGYGIHSRAFETSITEFADSAYAGIIGQANHSTLDAFGVVGDVSGSGSGDFVAGYFKASNSGSGGAHALRLYEGTDHTGSYLKVLDAEGSIGFEVLNFGDVTGTGEVQDKLTKWTGNGKEITSSQIEDNGSTLAFGTTQDANYYINIASAVVENGMKIHVTSDPVAEGRVLDLLIDNSGTTAIKKAINAVARNATNINIGAYFLADSGSTPTYDSLTYDLLNGALDEHSTALYAVALGNTVGSSNFGLRVRADQDIVGKNTGIHIRTRNSVGSSIPLVIDSGSQQAGYVLTSDANGNADWAAINAGVGDVLIGTSEDNNYLTKWDSAGASQITSSQIQDNGTTVAIGAPLSSSKYVHISSVGGSINELIHGSLGSASGDNTTAYFEAIGATGGTNVAGHFKSINGGTNYVLRLEDGTDNTGLYLKVLDSDGNIGFGTEAGLGTITDQGGTGGTTNYIPKFTAGTEIGDSVLNQHATAPTMAIGDVAAANQTFTIYNTDGDSRISNFVSTVNDTSSTTLHRAGYFQITSSNTASNEGIRAITFNSTDQNRAIYAYTGSVDPIASVPTHRSIAIVGVGLDGSNDAVGGYFGATQSNSARNYGAVIESANPGTGDHFALKIVDGTQQAGYVLTSDADGNANWQPSAAAAITGSGTADRVTKWSATSQIDDSIIRDDGARLGFNKAIQSGHFISSQSGELVGIEHINTSAASGVAVAGEFTTNGTRSANTNVGIRAYGTSNTYANIGALVQVGSQGFSTQSATDYALYANAQNSTGRTAYGVYSVMSGAGTTNIAGYFEAAGSATNYALYTDGGVRFTGLSTTPSAGDVLYSIDANGNLDFKTLTASDVGLGNVENTALSTWAGSTNLTTLGTITTGTWQGTQIADAYIASAATWNAKQDALTFGIANTNAVQINSTSVASGEYAKFTASGLESRSFAEVKTDLSLNNVENTALSTWSGSTNITTLGTITTGTWNGSVIANTYLDTGIADNKIVEIDQAGGASDNDYAKFTANGIEGRSYSEVKTDLSLNNVENTALSTWAGSTNITTLGTISAGTWNGSTIDDNYLTEDYAKVGTYTDGYVTRWNATTNTLDRSLIQDNGTRLFIGSEETTVQFHTLNSTLPINLGLSNTYTSGDATGLEISAITSNSNDNYGIKISAANAGAGRAYGISEEYSSTATNKLRSFTEIGNSYSLSSIPPDMALVVNGERYGTYDGSNIKDQTTTGVGPSQTTTTDAHAVATFLGYNAANQVAGDYTYIQIQSTDGGNNALGVIGVYADSTFGNHETAMFFGTRGSGDSNSSRTKEGLRINYDQSVTFGGFNTATEFTFPTADGSANQVLQTDGAGNVSWATVSGGGGGLQPPSVATQDVIPFMNSTGTDAEYQDFFKFDGTSLWVGEDVNNYCKINDATGSISMLDGGLYNLTLSPSNVSGGGKISSTTGALWLQASTSGSYQMWLDRTNKRVGIYTSTPDATLTIQGEGNTNSTSGFKYKNSLGTTIFEAKDGGTVEVNGSPIGNVSNTGTPLNNQLAVWTNATTIEGDSQLTWDSTGEFQIQHDGTVVSHLVSASTGTGNGPYLKLRKNNGTLASPGALTSGHTIGAIYFDGKYDATTGFRTGASIRARAEESWTTNAVGTSLRFETAKIGENVDSERMIITSAGVLELDNGTFLKIEADLNKRRKISLFEDGDNEFQFAGFGIESGGFLTSLSNDDVAYRWYAATSASSSKLMAEFKSITGNDDANYFEIKGQVHTTYDETGAQKTTQSGNAATIDWNEGNGQMLDLQGASNSVTLTLNNPRAGATYFLKIQQSTTSPQDITWPAAVKWPGNTAPTISTGADAIDSVVLFYDGTNYYGNFAQDYQ